MNPRLSFAAVLVVGFAAALDFGVVSTAGYAAEPRGSQSTQKKELSAARKKAPANTHSVASASFTPAADISNMQQLVRSLPATNADGSAPPARVSISSAGNNVRQKPAAATAQARSSVPDLPVGRFDLSTRNGKVLDFARAHLGQQVGDGECSALGTEALEFAGAELNKGTVFGNEILRIEAQPGDILQFREVELASADGSHWQLGDPDHTAVIGAVDGSRMLIFHQNINNVKRVRTDTIDLANVKSGTLTFYRSRVKAQ